MKPVAILGVGPAGLMAAHAVALAGKPVAMFGQPGNDGNIKRSVLGGAQFLHQPIPGVNDEDDPDTVVTFRVTGGQGVYRQKVYGATRVPFVSWDYVSNGMEQNAWNLRATYDVLWDLLGVDSVGNVMNITSEWLDDALKREWFDKIISTIPAPALCRTSEREDDMMSPHQFLGVPVKIAQEAMIAGEDVIAYDGTVEHSWYRSSVLFGIGSTEYGQHITTPLQSIKVTKPLRTNCDCYANEIVRCGRYGTWTKGVLTHHAFTDAAKLFA